MVIVCNFMSTISQIILFATSGVICCAQLLTMLVLAAGIRSISGCTESVGRHDSWIELNAMVVALAPLPPSVPPSWTFSSLSHEHIEWPQLRSARNDFVHLEWDLLEMMLSEMIFLTREGIYGPNWGIVAGLSNTQLKVLLDALPTTWIFQVLIKVGCS